MYIKDDGYPCDLQIQYNPHVSSLLKVCLNVEVINFPQYTCKVTVRHSR